MYYRSTLDKSATSGPEGCRLVENAGLLIGCCGLPTFWRFCYSDCLSISWDVFFIADNISYIKDNTSYIEYPALVPTAEAFLLLWIFDFALNLSRI